MAGTPSPPTRGDLESYKKKKKKQKRRPRTFWFDKGGHAMIFLRGNQRDYHTLNVVFGLIVFLW